MSPGAAGPPLSCELLDVRHTAGVGEIRRARVRGGFDFVHLASVQQLQLAATHVRRDGGAYRRAQHITRRPQLVPAMWRFVINIGLA